MAKAGPHYESMLIDNSTDGNNHNLPPLQGGTEEDSDHGGCSKLIFHAPGAGNGATVHNRGRIQVGRIENTTRRRRTGTEEDSDHGGCSKLIFHAPGAGNGATVHNRARIQVGRIENTTRRQLAFSRRRTGLLKKAYQLSVLCDAEIALIVFSTSGKLYEFASSSLGKILDRYEKCCAMVQTGSTRTVDEVEYWKNEAQRLRSRQSMMEMTFRNMVGEDLGAFQMNDLQALESKLDSGLSRVRVAKTQLMMEQVQELRTREHYLLQENEALRAKLSEVTVTGLLSSTTASQEMQQESSKTPKKPSVHQECSISAADETTLKLGSRFTGH